MPSQAFRPTWRMAQSSQVGCMPHTVWCVCGGGGGIWRKWMKCLGGRVGAAICTAIRNVRYSWVLGAKHHHAIISTRGEG